MSEDYLVHSVIGFFFGIGIFIGGLKSMTLQRLIKNTPTSKVRSIAMGVVEICGKAVPIKKEILKSPFSNNDCVYYRYTIEELVKSKNSSHWRTVKKGDSFSNFFVRDNTGEVLVDPRGAKIDIPFDNRFQSGLSKKLTPHVVSFLDSINFNTKAWIFNKNLRYTEYYIAPNDELYILGTANKNPNAPQNISDSTKNIIIQNSQSKFLKNPYYISDCSEKEVLKKFTWKIVGGMFGGGALSLVCFFLILLRIGLF